MVCRGYIAGRRSIASRIYDQSTNARRNEVAAPCMDDLMEQPTWHFEFIVPKSFLQYPVTVLCSGTFDNEEDHKTDPEKKVVKYSLDVKTTAHNIGFAIGPFERFQLQYAEKDDQISMLPEIFGYCMPNKAQLLGETFSTNYYGDVRQTLLPLLIYAT